jgi:hypothetical protein
MGVSDRNETARKWPFRKALLPTRTDESDAFVEMWKRAWLSGADAFWATQLAINPHADDPARSVAGGSGLGQGSSRPPNNTSTAAGSFQSASDGPGTTHSPRGQDWRLWFRVLGRFAVGVAHTAAT